MNLARWLPSLRPAPRPQGPHARLRIALVADELSATALAHECTVLPVTPANAARVLTRERPDLLFVESAWRGHRDAWKFRIASYPDHPQRSNADLLRVAAIARDAGLPAVFWNKEDGVHFERFLPSARAFDTIFTVDAGSVARYRGRIGAALRHVGVLPFAVAPAVHAFAGSVERRPEACFVGTWDRNIHPGRLARQQLLLAPAAAAMGLVAVDRNSNRRGANYRFPAWPGLLVHPRVAYERTAAVYRGHRAALNVNTVEDSPTMFSRRLIEIMASGGLAVSTPARAIDRLFPDCCHVVASEDAARALFERLARDGRGARDVEMIHHAARVVHDEHTWARRLDTVLDAIGRRASAPLPAAAT